MPDASPGNQRIESTVGEIRKGVREAAEVIYAECSDANNKTGKILLPVYIDEIIGLTLNKYVRRIDKGETP